MYNLEENLLESFINLKGLLSQKVEQQSKQRLSIIRQVLDSFRLAVTIDCLNSMH